VPDSDLYEPSRRAALRYILGAEETVAEAYARGIDEWLDSVRGAVFSGRGFSRLLDPLGIFAMATRFSRLLVSPVTAAVESIIAGAFARSAPDLDYSSRPWVQQHLAEVGNHLRDTPDWLYGQVTDQLQAAINLGESIPVMAERVEASLLQGGADVWSNRGQTVARTEAISAYNGGTQEAMRAQAGEFDLELEKVWLASMDTRTRDTHFAADGQRVPLEGMFNVGGFFALVPGDESLPPEERINCRCSVLYVEPGEETDMSNRGFRGDAATRTEVRRRAQRGVIRTRDR
jgi:hypothetical protein